MKLQYGMNPLDVIFMYVLDDYLSLLQNFHHWATEYRAQTHQAREITWLIRLFINMTRRGQIHQAPPHPPGLVRERERERERRGETKKFT